MLPSIVAGSLQDLNGVEGRRCSSRPEGLVELDRDSRWLASIWDRAFSAGKAVAGLPALHSSLLCRRGNDRWTPLRQRGRLRRLQFARGVHLRVAGARPGRQRLREMHLTPFVGKQVWPPRARRWLGDSEP